MAVPSVPPERPADSRDSEALGRLGLGVGELDADGLMIWASHRLSQLLGPGSTRSGFNLRTLRWFTPEGRVHSWVDALINGQQIDQTTVLALPGADQLHLWVRAVPRLEDGEFIGADLSLTDITGRVITSADGAHENAMYRSVAEHLADIVLVMEAEIITWVSPSVLRVLGYQPAELLGRPAPILIHPNDLQDLVVTPAMPTMSGQSRMLTAEGTYKWIEFNINARFAEDGVPQTVYAVLRDIDERVRLEDLVESGRRRQRRALDASPDGFAIFRAVAMEGNQLPSFQLEFINEAGAAGLDGDATSLLGRDVLEFFPVAPDHALILDMVAALTTGQAQQSWITNTTGVGPVHLFAVQARLDEHSIVSTWRDVSEQVEHTQRLARANAEADAARATLHGALNATSDGFVVFEIERDPHEEKVTGLRVTHLNTAANTQFALTPGDLIHVDGGPLRAALEVGGLWGHILATTSDIKPRHHRTHVLGVDDEWVASYDNTIAPDGRLRLVLTFRDATDDERTRRDLDLDRREAEHAANHDPLTGLPNRALLLRRMHEALAECLPDELVGVVFCDLNGFKDVNDTLGHEAGDTVLRAVAERLRRVLRPRDTAARLAGDEFVLILRDLQRDWDAADFFARVTAKLTQPVLVAGAETNPSASLGIVLADPHARPATDRRPDLVLAAADRIMYQNKAVSRNSPRPVPAFRDR